MIVAAPLADLAASSTARRALKLRAACALASPCISEIVEETTGSAIWSYRRQALARAEKVTTRLGSRTPLQDALVYSAGIADRTD